MDVYDFKYILPESVKKKDKAKEKEAKKEKAENFDSFKDALKDTKIAWLAKLPSDVKSTQVREGVQKSQTSPSILQLKILHVRTNVFFW